MPRRHSFDDDSMSRGREDRSDTRDRDERGYPERQSRGFFDDGGSRRSVADEERRPGGRGERQRDFERGSDRGSDRGRGQQWRERSREERNYGPDRFNRGVPMDETEMLIASNKVEGTPVHDRRGDKLGTIHNLMIDKVRGHVAYAVVRHSAGFLGLNERYYPLEWDQLTYDPSLGGYHTDLEEEDLKGFGSFDAEGRWHRGLSGGRTGERGRGEERGRGRTSERGSW